jgi:hypothetical protein
MYTFLLVCAVLGGVTLVLQLLLGLAGLEHGHHDLGAHGGHFGDAHAGDGHGSAGSEGFNLLSVRALAAGLAFFGLAGLGIRALGLGPVPVLLAAAAGGLAAAFVVAALMRYLLRLESDGTVRIEHALGQAGTVYVPIPGERAGRGKVLLTLQNRTVEYQAVTPTGALPTGASVTVVEVLGPDLVEVVVTPTLEY